LSGQTVHPGKPAGAPEIAKYQEISVAAYLLQAMSNWSFL
jgi:hypothetical protein